MTTFTRAERVAGKVQRVLSEILTTRVKDPRFEMVTITAVIMTADLKLAKVYFSTAGDMDKAEQARRGFKTARGYIKRALARELGLRYMPDLRFYYDDTFDTSARIDKLLKSLKSDGSDHPIPEER